MRLTFKQLWNHYPDDDNPCTTMGKSNFANQCAIRVGVALTRSGVSTTTLRGVTHCWQHPKREGHVLRASELASALMRAQIDGLGRAQTLGAKDFKTQLAGKTGIIFFRDYWQRSRDRDGAPTGDHIDLWNQSRLTDWSSWIRVQLGIVMPGFWSDLEKAKSITFWEVK